MNKKQILAQYFHERAKKAAKARNQKLSSQERQRLARQAAQKRWAKKRGDAC